MVVTIDEMVEVGLHFGHQTRKRNPKMEPFIHGEKNGSHIIDLIQTYSYLKQVSAFLTEYTSRGKTVLFVGTKKQATRLIAKIALQCNSFYVNQRWLGGMLTNWETIKTSIAKLNELQFLEKSGKLANLPKKEAAIYKKQKDRLQKYLGGLKNMISIPDIVIIVGQPEEINAVNECRKLGIRTITILDTNCDPSLADLFIPANDDSVGSINLVLTQLLIAIQEGQKQFQQKKANLNQRKFSTKTQFDPNKTVTASKVKKI